MTEMKKQEIQPISGQQTSLSVSLPPWLRSRLIPKLTADFDLVGYELKPGPKPHQPLLDQLKDDLEKELWPASKAALAQEIGRCLVSTAKRKTSEVDVKALGAILIETLQEFPARAALAALREWGENQIWWPTVAEIRKLAKSHAAKTFAVQEALKKLQQEPEKKPEPARQPLSEAIMQKAREFLAERAI